MNKKTLAIIFTLLGLIIIALCVFCYNLYDESIAMKDAEKAKQEQMKLHAETDTMEPYDTVGVDFDSSLEEEYSDSYNTEELLASLRGTWEGGGMVSGTFVVLTVMAFDGSSGWSYTHKSKDYISPGSITISPLGNNEYGIYNDKLLMAKYNSNGNLIDNYGMLMKKVSNDVPSEPFRLKTYFSNSFCEMGEYGIEEQYVYKHLIEEREGLDTGATTFRVISREKNVEMHKFECGSPQNTQTDRVRGTIGLQYYGTETHKGKSAKVTMEMNLNGKYSFYTSISGGDFLMYNCTLLE